MSQRHSQYARKADEEYNTPPWVAATIAPWLKHKGVRSIWEPAIGNGQFAEALRGHGFEVDPTTTNYFAWRLWPPETDGVVTNPPYGKRGELAEAFAYHALALGAPIVALLLRVDFDSAKTRRRLFADCPFFAGKIVLLDRIDWFERLGKAGSSTNHAWMLWSRSHRGPPWIAYAQRDKNLGP